MFSRAETSGNNEENGRAIVGRVQSIVDRTFRWPREQSHSRLSSPHGYLGKWVVSWRAVDSRMKCSARERFVNGNAVTVHFAAITSFRCSSVSTGLPGIQWSLLLPVVTPPKILLGKTSQCVPSSKASRSVLSVARL